MNTIGSVFKKGYNTVKSLFTKGNDPRKTLKEGDFDVVDAIKNSYNRNREEQENFGKDKGYHYIKELSDDDNQLYYNPEKKHLFMSISGTKNLDDVQTDAMLMRGKLKDTQRYKKSEMALKKAKQMYDVQSSSGVGHSLGASVLSKLSIDKKVSVNKGSELGARTRQGETHIRTAGDIVSLLGANNKNTTTYHMKGFSILDPTTWLRSHTYKNLKDEGFRIGGGK